MIRRLLSRLFRRRGRFIEHPERLAYCGSIDLGRRVTIARYVA